MGNGRSEVRARGVAAALMCIAFFAAHATELPSRRILQDPSGVSDADANNPQSRGADKITALPDVGNTQQLQDPLGRGYNPGISVQPNTITSVSGAYRGPERDFANELNYPQPNSGNAAPAVTVSPTPGAAGTSFGPGYYPYGTFPVNWVWAGIFVVPRYVSGSWLSAITGVGAQQTATVVLDYFTAKMPNWPGSPTFWSNPVGFPYVWRYYQYAAYSNTYGSPYFKTDPLVLTMNDQYGNKLVVTGRAVINLNDWSVVNFRIDGYNFIPLPANQAPAQQQSPRCGSYPAPTYGYVYKCCRWCSKEWCSTSYGYSWTTDAEAAKGTYACEGGSSMNWGSCDQSPPNDGSTYRCCATTQGGNAGFYSWISTYQVAQAPYTWSCAGAKK